MNRSKRSAAPSESNLLELVRPFDPLAEGAEAEYDAVVRRLNRVRARRARDQKELYLLEDQFVKNDLRVRSGKREGLPLSPRGRRQRLTRLLDLSEKVRRLDAEERFAMQALARMNEALDRWARETYGP